MSFSLVSNTTSSFSSSSSSSSAASFPRAGTSVGASSVFPSFANSSVTASSANFQPTSSSNESGIQNPGYSLTGSRGVGLLSQYAKVAKVLKLAKTTGLVEDVATLVASYAIPEINQFGAAEWQKFYGVDVGLEPELPGEFYAWWGGPDAIEPAKRNCDTHLPPVLRPRWITETDAGGNKILSCYSLNTLGRLVQHPKEGPPSKYYSEHTLALQQHGNTKAGPARWLIMRKGVLARNQTYDQQKKYIRQLNAGGADYDEMPSAPDLAAVVFATYVRTNGDRHLGDGTGKEERWSCSRCKERVRDPGNGYLYPSIVGGFASGGLYVSSYYDYEVGNVGVAALRKF